MIKSARFFVLLIACHLTTPGFTQGVIPSVIPGAIDRLVSEGQQGFEKIKGKLWNNDGDATNWQSTYNLPGGGEADIDFDKSDRYTQWVQPLYADPDEGRAQTKFGEYVREFKKIFPNSIVNQHQIKLRDRSITSYVITGEQSNVKFRLNLKDHQKFDRNNKDVWMVRLSATWARD